MTRSTADKVLVVAMDAAIARPKELACLCVFWHECSGYEAQTVFDHIRFRRNFLHSRKEDFHRGDIVGGNLDARPYWRYSV